MPENYAPLKEAVEAIAQRCDGAHSLDGQGFSAIDTVFGKSLAVLPLDQWDQDVAAAAYQMLGHYRTQLADCNIRFDTLPRVQEAMGARYGRHRAIRATADAMKVRSVSERSVLRLEGSEISLSSPFHGDMVSDIRNMPGRRWDSARKVNVFPVESVRSVRELAAKWLISIPAEIMDLPDVEPPVHEEPLGLEIDGNLVLIRFPYDPALVSNIKETVPAVRWNATGKNWATVTANLSQALQFAQRHGLTVQPGLPEALESEKRRAQELHEASKATDANISVGSALDLLPYQRAGVAYATKTRRCIIGDDMGLGKTAEGMASVVAGNALPCVVVCPNTLKPNWELEVAKFFPSLTVNVVSGTQPEPLPAADFTVVNYDIVAQRADDLIALSPNSLIVDESHAIKNGKAVYACPTCNVKCRVNSKRCGECGAKFSKPTERWTVRRTEGVMRVARAVPAEGMVLLLSGTPIQNRPAELVAQLIAIDQIEAFGGRWRFMQRYAPGGTGATNLVELNRKLRETCFIRRTKSDVFDELPPRRTARQAMPVPADGMKRYREIEHDVVHFLADRARQIAEEAGEDGTRAYIEKALRAEAAEHLVRISVLKNAVADLKYDAMVDWIDNFLEDSEEKIIVFAEHVEIVERLAEHYGDLAVKIRGGVSLADRNAAVQRFQNDNRIRVFVGNMAAASEGITLTAASNVAFLELGWTPSIHAQCASRCYARANDMHGATAWYLLARNTIDDDIFALLEQKSKVVNAATDGVEVEKQGSILADLVVSLAERGMSE